MIEISYFTAKSYEPLCVVFIIVQIDSCGLVSGQSLFADEFWYLSFVHIDIHNLNKSLSSDGLRWRLLNGSLQSASEYMSHQRVYVQTRISPFLRPSLFKVRAGVGSRGELPHANFGSSIFQQNNYFYKARLLRGGTIICLRSFVFVHHPHWHWFYSHLNNWCLLVLVNWELADRGKNWKHCLSSGLPIDRGFLREKHFHHVQYSNLFESFWCRCKLIVLIQMSPPLCKHYFAPHTKKR